MDLYRNWTEDKIRQYTGRMEQVAGITRTTFDDGPSRGIRCAQVRNGSGLQFDVLLDRGMDIGQAFYKGVPLAFLTPSSFGHPAFYDAEGFGWLRNWGGGLVTGCGLSNVGVPVESGSSGVAGPDGLHGRLSNLPAEEIHTQSGLENLSVGGTVRQAQIFGENLEMTRTVSTAFGDNSLTITDQITNRGFRSEALMQLYHINVGFPLLTENSRLSAVEHGIQPRTENDEKDQPNWFKSQAPAPGTPEQCFYHDLPADAEGMASMQLQSPDCGLALTVSFRKAELPFFTQWKMMASGAYAMGLEPANCHPDGREAEQENGTLRTLEPGESTEHVVRIKIEEI